VAKTEIVLLFKTTLTGNLGFKATPGLSIAKSISPSLTIQVSNLWGLLEIFYILTIGSYSFSSAFYTILGQGFLLQSLSIIDSPAQTSPPFLGGMHNLCRYCLPPPQAKVHWLQSYKITHLPSTFAFGFTLPFGGPLSGIPG